MSNFAVRVGGLDLRPRTNGLGNESAKVIGAMGGVDDEGGDDRATAGRRRGRSVRSPPARRAGGSACALSPQRPGVRATRTGNPGASTAAWTFVVSPPRERAIARARAPSPRWHQRGPCRSRALQITGPADADHGPCRWWRPRGRTRSRGRRASPRGAAPTPPHGSGAGSGGARCASGRPRVAGRAAGPPRAPARAPHPSTASPSSRSSTAVRPLSPASPANSGAIRPHRASVNVHPLIAAPSDDRESTWIKTTP